MTKNATKRAFMLSLLSLLMCCTMLLGTTFAWFTDTVTSTGNRIVAGTLDVQLLMDKTENGNYVNISGDQGDIFDSREGGNGVNWEPGKTEIVYLGVKNAGTLALKYDILLDVKDNGLAGALEYAVIDGQKAKVDADNWTELQAKAATGPVVDGYMPILPGGKLAAEKTNYFALAVHMREDAGNEYQSTKEQIKEIVLDIKVVASQLTAETDSFNDQYDADALPGDVLATPDTIDAVLAEVEEGTVIGLAAGYYDEITLTQDNLTLVSNAAVVGFLNLNAKDGAVIDGLTFDQKGAKETYSFDKVQKATGYYANITGDVDSPKAADNVTVQNCTFISTDDTVVATDKYVPVHFAENGAPTERATNLYFYNNEFKCSAYQYLCLNYVADGEVIVSNNTFGAGNFTVGHNIIQATSNAADWTVTNNSFYNWNVIKTAIGSSRQGADVAWTVTGNTFNNVDGAVVMALKTSYTDANTTIVFANNTTAGGMGTIVDTAVNGENETVYGGKKIQLDENVVVVNSSASLKAALKTGTNVVYAPAGTYDSISLGNGVTLIGEEGTVITDAGSNCALGSTHNTTVKNITFVGKNAQRYAYTSGKVVFENCTFKGEGTGSLSWAIHYDGHKADSEILYKNCDIYGWVAIAGGYKSLEFDGCNFYGNGDFGLCRSYSDFTVKNCTFDYSAVDPNGTRSVGIEALSGATATIINCTNVNGDIMDVVSLKYVGTSYEGNYVVEGNSLVTKPIENKQPESYTGELFPAGSNIVCYENMILKDDAQIVINNGSAGAAIENVVADITGDAVIQNTDQAIYMYNCDFTLADGAKLIKADHTVYQVFIVNVKVNGEYLTQDTAAQYLENVAWYQVLVEA